MPNIQISTEDQELLDQLFSYGNHTSQPNYIDELYMNTNLNSNRTYTRNSFPTIGWEIEFYIQPPTNNRPPLGLQDIKNRLLDFIQENNEWLEFNSLHNFAELGTDATPSENTIYELKIKPFAL